MRIDAISIGINPPHDVNVIIEVPVGGEPIKYEMDKNAGTMVVDRYLYTAMRYPGNYGFIPHTLSDDGDPCDVLVLSPMPLITGVVVRCRPIGMLKMEDEAGALKAAGATQSGPADRAAAASYVAELSAELAALARQHGLEALGYILDMARLEAENATRHVNERR